MYTYTVIENNEPAVSVSEEDAAMRAADFAARDDGWSRIVAAALALDILRAEGRFDREAADGTRILITRDR